MVRVIGDNHHGNSNEHNLVKAFNGNKIKDLNNNLREFIKFICDSFFVNYDEKLILHSEYEPDTKLKQDLYLTIGDKTYAISLKMGTGNSVHQEKCEDFINYIQEEFGVSEDACNDIRFFTWADGTLDGKGSLLKGTNGKIISRFDAARFKNTYPEKRLNIQNFLNTHEEELIRHFMLDGRHNSQVDIIYHGTPLDGAWITTDTVVSYQLDNSRSKNPKDRSCLSIGRMTLQVWNPSLKGTLEHKRGQIQIKYGDMKDDFIKLMRLSTNNVGTFMGNTEEFDISRFLNRNKKNRIWNNFDLKADDIENMYVVKVENRVKSKLSDKLVYPKSDAYLVVAEIPDDYLLANEYVLTENGINKFDYSIVEDSGISVKLKYSKNFTIQKLTKESFYKAFRIYLGDDVEFIFAGLLVFSNETEIIKNNKVYSDLGIDLNQFILFFSERLDNRTLNINQKKDLDCIRRKAQEIIKNTIVENRALAESIFIGSGWFQNPYYAKYIYLDGNISPNEITDFSITTGSGRSKGKYSIEIKPK